MRSSGKKIVWGLVPLGKGPGYPLEQTVWCGLQNSECDDAFRETETPKRFQASNHLEGKAPVRNWRFVTPPTVGSGPGRYPTTFPRPFRRV